MKRRNVGNASRSSKRQSTGGLLVPTPDPKPRSTGNGASRGAAARRRSTGNTLVDIPGKATSAMRSASRKVVRDSSSDITAVAYRQSPRKVAAVLGEPPPRFLPGARVQALWFADPSAGYFNGTVVSGPAWSSHGDTYGVLFDDGDQDDRVLLSSMKPLVEVIDSTRIPSPKSDKPPKGKASASKTVSTSAAKPTRTSARKSTRDSSRATAQAQLQKIQRSQSTEDAGLAALALLAMSTSPEHAGEGNESADASVSTDASPAKESRTVKDLLNGLLCVGVALPWMACVALIFQQENVCSVEGEGLLESATKLLCTPFDLPYFGKVSGDENAFFAVNVFFFFFVDVLFWLINLAQGSTWLIDPYWTLVPPLVCVFYKYHPTANPDPTRATVLLVLVLTWALRLTHNYFRREQWHFGWREDWRFAEYREAHGKAWAVSSFFVAYFSQHLMLLGLTMPFWAVHSPNEIKEFGPIDFLACIVCVTGIAIGWVSDNQLFSYMALPRGSKLLVLDTGLWKISRHPNHLGEQLWWIGVALFAYAAHGGLCRCVFGLVFNHLCDNLVTVYLIEKRMLQNPARAAQYEAYIAKTSPVYPLKFVIGKAGREQDQDPDSRAKEAAFFGASSAPTARSPSGRSPVRIAASSRALSAGTPPASPSESAAAAVVPNSVGGFVKGSTVIVDRRQNTGGPLKLGGVGRVTKLHPEEGAVDVKYVLGGSEKKVEVKYVHEYTV